MSEETKKTSGEENQGNESNTLGQDDISKLLNEMQSEENSSKTEDQPDKTADDTKKPESDETKEDENKSKVSTTLDQEEISKLIGDVQDEENSSDTEDQTKKTTNDTPKQESDETKNDESEGEDSTTLNQDDISNLIGDMQNKAKSSEVAKIKDTTESVEKTNEGEKDGEPEMPEDKAAKTAESSDNIEDKEVEEKGESQEKDIKVLEEDKISAKKTDEKDKEEENNGSFEGLDFDDENEINGDPDTVSDKKKDTGNNEENNNIIKKKDEDKDKKSEKDKNGGKAVLLKDVKKRFKGNRFKLLMSCILCVVLIGVLFGGYVIFIKSETETIKAEKTIQSEKIAKPENKYNEKETAQKIKVKETSDILLSDSIIAKLEEITELRNELLIKEGEIAELINNYKNGINEMEDQILRIKQNSPINSFSVAIKNKKIEFRMMTIQRCLAYIEKIKSPYKWLNQGIEELLYLKRKIEIDARISRVINGIDLDKMIQEIDIVIKSYRNGIEKLEIDMENVEIMSLEIIWERIIDKDQISSKNNTNTNKPLGIKKSVFRSKERNNRIIWEEICNGNFKRKNEVTNLSTEAAKCLSKWKHADLFLNGLSELSPNVARHLLKWQGNWMCLNGVKKISPEAAKYLFQWQGNWISLNGISEISSGLLRYLPQWQGKQLELMGLKYNESESQRLGLKALVKWEKSGGKLYIPKQIRKVVNKL